MVDRRTLTTITMPDGVGSPDASALGGMRRLLFFEDGEKNY